MAYTASEGVLKTLLSQSPLYEVDQVQLPLPGLHAL